MDLNVWELVTCHMILTVNIITNSHIIDLLLPPANEVWGKVMFLHLSVILFTVATEAGGTHPTGMHTWSCIVVEVLLQRKVLSKHQYGGNQYVYYRPQRSWAKVISLQASVCPHGGVSDPNFRGGCLTQIFGGV